jgi:topoisomerase-4 subunit A
MATSIPSHNVDELCAAALHLLKTPNARIDTLMEYVKGPDFPTGGICVESPEALREAYATGRGSMRVRARYEVEQLGRGTWQIVITEIPYQIQKSRLIEKIAELMNARQLPMLDDIRDESAEDIRVVIEPKSKNFDPAQVMAVLYRQTDLESRFSLNMNVLDSEGVPRVMGLREVLTQWLAHRNVVLVRKSQYRLDKITARLEVLDGYLIAYLNLDEVIRIIREEDEPRDDLMKAFKLTQVQADAILNMRLRALRKLEEDGIRTEHAALSAEMKDLQALLKSDSQQQAIIAAEIKDIRKQFGPKSELGKRRTSFEQVSEDEAVPMEIMVEKEPVTIVCSEKGWIRAMKGHAENSSKLTYKDGDKGAFALHAMTTDKLVLFVSNGRAYTLDVAKLPGGRGNGDPVRMMLDIEPSDEIIEIFVHQPDRKLLVASRIGNGFVVAENEMIANRKAGKQILNVKAPDEAAICVPVLGDKVAVLGENRKLLCFALADVPEMPRGKGVRLQRHGDGHLADARCYSEKDGLKISDKAGRERIFTDLEEWQGLRAQAGRIRPKGFPTDGLMGPAFPNRL